MKTLFSEYTPFDPRDQEGQINPAEESMEHNRPGTTTNPEEENPRVPTVTPETDNGGPAARGKDGFNHPEEDELIPIVKDEPDEEEEDEEEEENNEEEDVDEEMDEERESEPGRDTSTTHTNPGDEFSSPANNTWKTNFEDPAQNRKTDPMTDHEPRVEGI